MKLPSVAETQETLPVLIVDDHPVVRDGLRFSLSKISNLEVCAEAGDIDSALKLAAEHQPRIVILDFIMGGRDGYEGIAQMRQVIPGAAILVFSMSPEELFAENAIKAGADGYLMKTDGFKKLQNALQQMLAGRIYFSEKMQQRLSNPNFHLRRRQDLSCLTERELQVFHRLGEGKSTGEIAEELHLSVKTIATHRENMKAKLGVTNGAELNRMAITFVLGQKNS